MAVAVIEAEVTVLLFIVVATIMIIATALAVCLGPTRLKRCACVRTVHTVHESLQYVAVSVLGGGELASVCICVYVCMWERGGGGCRHNNR